MLTANFQSLILEDKCTFKRNIEWGISQRRAMKMQYLAFTFLLANLFYYLAVFSRSVILNGYLILSGEERGGGWSTERLPEWALSLGHCKSVVADFWCVAPRRTEKNHLSSVRRRQHYRLSVVISVDREILKPY